MNRIYLSLIALSLQTASLLLLTGCESPGGGQSIDNKHPGSKYRTTRDNTIQSILSRADSAESPRANTLRLQAAQLAIRNGNWLQASNILILVNNMSNEANGKNYAFLQSELAIQDSDSELALYWLNHRYLSIPLTLDEQIKRGYLRARAFYSNRSFVASARERIFFDSLLSPEERVINHEKIFDALLELPANSLTAQAQKAITGDLRGWLSLAAMTKQYQNDPARQLEELGRWKSAWANHPAAKNLPESLQTLSRIVEQQPENIALLLPIQGTLGTYGRAIRDGIIAARYHLGNPVRIRVYDSSEGNAASLINIAVADGAELIIGPLDRTLVADIARIQNLPVPVLALNRTSDGSIHPDLYQFGLAPEDEMVQVADQVFKEGKRSVLALYPDSDWGERNYLAFRNRWISLGGKVIRTAAYQDEKDYSDLIKSILGVDQSDARANDVRRIIGERIEFLARRRQDIDFIFLLGNQAQARGINPTLDYFYAEDIPVYSTSYLYQPNDSVIESLDLNGIRFCDIPWKLTNNDPIQIAVQSLWKGATRQLAPFYALGVDAFRLYPRLQQLKEVPSSKIYGSTGILQLNSNNVLVRKLMWAQFSEGQVVPVPLVMSFNEQL